MSKEDKQAIIEDFLYWCFLEKDVNLMQLDYSREDSLPSFEYVKDLEVIKEYLSD